MSHVSKMSHVSYRWVMSHMDESCLYRWVMSLSMRVMSLSMSHVSDRWVISPIFNSQCPTIISYKYRQHKITIKLQKKKKPGPCACKYNTRCLCLGGLYGTADNVATVGPHWEIKETRKQNIWERSQKRNKFPCQWTLCAHMQQIMFKGYSG